MERQSSRQKDQVDPGDQLSLWASWASLFCSGNQKWPSSSLETFYCHILFFRLCCLYYLGMWKSMTESLFIRIRSSAFVWAGCGDFGGWVGREIVIPLKYLSWKNRSRTWRKQVAAFRKKGTEKSCEQSSFFSNKHALKSRLTSDVKFHSDKLPNSWRYCFLCSL